MPARCKHFSNLFIEIVLFVSLFTLLGHVTVNFWERYMIQTELNKMKSSLHGLRFTIDVIGNAYDNLHEELKVLAHVTEPDKKSRSIYTDKIQSSPKPNHVLAHSDIGIITKNPPDTNIPETANIVQNIYAQANILGQEQFTNTDNADRVEKIDTTPTIRDKLQNIEIFEKKDAITYSANAKQHKNYTQRASTSIKTKSGSPLVSTAAGRGSAHNRKIQTFAHCKQRDPYNQYNSKIHQCHRNEINI